MTSNHDRASTLVSALRAGIERDLDTLRTLLSDDVKAWTPTFSAGSLDDVLQELAGPANVFSELALDATPLDVSGDFACVEWTVEGTHTGELRLGEQLSIEATGIRITIHGVTVAEFDGERICSLRQYWDEFAALEQLGVSLDATTPPPADVTDASADHAV